MKSLASFCLAFLAAASLTDASAQPGPADTAASGAVSAPKTRAEVKSDTRAAAKRGELGPDKVYDSAPFPPDCLGFDRQTLPAVFRMRVGDQCSRKLTRQPTVFAGLPVDPLRA